MPLMLKRRRRVDIFIAATSIALLPMRSFAKTKLLVTTDLLENLKKGEPWDRGVLTSTKMVTFQQLASGGTDATSVSKITLAYFTSPDCTGSTAGTGFYTTPDGTTFPISVGTPFGMVAASAWNVGHVKLGISNTDMANIKSIAVTFKSTNNNTPQSNFSNVSFACVPVTCTVGPGGQCTSTSGPQSFTLKTTASIGDPADGGVIACMNGGLNNLVASTIDNSGGIQWGGYTQTTNATSTTDGALNTTTIVTCLSGPGSPGGCPGNIDVNTYAAGICNTYSAAGGYTSGWFLPAGNNTGSDGQLNCLYTNKTAIGSFASAAYWSSTERSGYNAWFQDFSGGGQNFVSKQNTFHVRCVQAFTP